MPVRQILQTFGYHDRTDQKQKYDTGIGCHQAQHLTRTRAEPITDHLHSYFRNGESAPDTETCAGAEPGHADTDGKRQDVEPDRECNGKDLAQHRKIRMHAGQVALANNGQSRPPWLDRNKSEPLKLGATSS